MSSSFAGYSFTLHLLSHSRLTHHKASSHVGLEDSIKGALGVRAVLKGEQLLYVVQAAPVVSCPHYSYRPLGVKVGWFVALSAGRIKDIRPQLHRCGELFWVAGMGHLGLHTFSLNDAKQKKVKSSSTKNIEDAAYDE